MHISTRHDATSTAVKVSGELTAAGTRRLAAMLNAMAWAECERATIHLSDISSVCSELLRVLRTARTRTQGRLTVTAERSGARFSLALVGLGWVRWSGPGNTTETAGRARWITMRFSERERWALTEIEVGLVSADPRHVQRCDDISRQILFRAADPPQPAHGGRRIRFRVNTGTAEP